MRKTNYNLLFLILTLFLTTLVDGTEDQRENWGDREGKLCKYNLNKLLSKILYQIITIQKT